MLFDVASRWLVVKPVGRFSQNLEWMGMVGMVGDGWMVGMVGNSWE